MPDEVKAAFEKQIVEINVQSILPSKTLRPGIKASTKYKRIAASIAEVGLVEPLSVVRQKDAKYLLLDGHVRLSVLIDNGSAKTRCVIAVDDEAFTYNKRVNRLAPIQEHFMIVRALERGVSEAKLARALDVDIKVIKQRRHMLSGISSEVADLLKDKSIGHNSFQKLRKMKAIRQLEVAELMVSANNYTSSYVKALLATSKPNDLHRPDQLKSATGLSGEQMARLEREMASVSADYKDLEISYGDDMLVLVVAAGFLERLLSKPELERFLKNRHPEILDNFRSIVQTSSLDQPSAAV